MPTGIYTRTEEHKRKLSESNKKPHFKQRGKNNANWKGGICKDKDGYIYILSRNHPHKNNNNYVFEHRLVMEKHLGRILLPTEIVHHINSNISDNRIENLMLFVNKRKHNNFHKDIRPHEV